MAHRVETMAYAGQTPWHGLGYPVEGNLTPKQMLRAAKLNWTVSKVPIYMKRGNKLVEIFDRYAIQRDTDGAFMSIAADKYKHFQNADVFEFFTEFCEEGDMTMETAGSLDGGRYIWALAKVNGGFDLPGRKRGLKDHVSDYVLLSQPHVVGYSMIIKWTGIRVVCWNTLSLALGRTIMGDKVTEFRVPHTLEFTKEVQQQAKITLQLAKASSDEFKEAAMFLASRRATAEQVDEFFGAILHWDGSKQVTASGREKKPPRMLAMFQDALERAPGAELASAEGTWWGALNAVTYTVDHEVGNSRDTALRSAWLGDFANLKQEALQKALVMAA